MKHVWQPAGSYCCGQCCIAIITGETLDTVFKVVGKKGVTNTRTLSKALKKLKFRCASRLIPIYGKIENLPELCILKIKLDWKKNNWHWVVKNGDEIYNPSKPKPVNINSYNDLPGITITSYLKVGI